MVKVDYEKEARELLNELHGGIPIDEEELAMVITRLKKFYNYGIGYKRDRLFLSKEEHEQKYAKKRKTPAKAYKKK
jgi:hypothetical protein